MICKTCKHTIQLFSCKPNTWVHSKLHIKPYKYLEVHKYCMYGKCKCKNPKPETQATLGVSS